MADQDSVRPPESPATPPQDAARTPLDPGLTPLPVDELRGGDREAAAAYIARNAPLIRRRLRGKIARSLRRLFDSDDLMATITRRLDDLVRRRKLTAGSEAELWSLLEHLAVNALSDVARRALREQPGLAQDRAPPGAESGIEPKSGPDGPDSLLNQCLAELRLETDQRILRMRLEHHTHAEIAAAEGVSVAAARKRWQRIRSAIQTVIGLIGVPTAERRGKAHGPPSRPARRAPSSPRKRPH